MLILAMHMSHYSRPDFTGLKRTYWSVSVLPYQLTWLSCFLGPLFLETTSIFNVSSFPHWSVSEPPFMFHDNSKKTVFRNSNRGRSWFLTWSLSVGPHCSHTLEDVWVLILFAANLCFSSFRGRCASVANSGWKIMAGRAACYLDLHTSLVH